MKGIVEITEIEFQSALALMKRYLNQNGMIKKPFHFTHYLLRDCKIGDYVMRVKYTHSKQFLTNKLYEVIDIRTRKWDIDGEKHLYVLDEYGKEYEIRTINFGYDYAFFRKKDVEKKIYDEVPDDIIDYNKELKKLKVKNV